MDTDIPFFADLNIAILGLGLMGGSLAMALHGKCKSLAGLDIDPPTLVLAHELKIADVISSDPRDVLPQSDIVILATPVRVIISLLQYLPSLHPGSPVVMDLGSTKVQIMNAMADLPPRFDPIGAHPMCGKENLSLQNADPAIFKNAPFAFIRLGRTSEKALSFAKGLCQLVGSRPLWITSELQDKWTASTSHLPYLIASALVQSTPEDSVPLMGTGFRSTTRLAATSPSIMVDILKTNRDNILDSLGRFKNSITDLEELLKNEDFTNLSEMLEMNCRKKASFSTEKQSERALS
jgi:prephenate dehydrogenase